jgi:hypothetical protein
MDVMYSNETAVGSSRYEGDLFGTMDWNSFYQVANRSFGWGGTGLIQTSHSISTFRNHDSDVCQHLIARIPLASLSLYQVSDDQ